MPSSRGGYRERLRVPGGWWLGGALVVGTVWWIFVLATPWWFAVSLAVLVALLVGWALSAYGGVLIVTDGDGLRAGRARLPWEHVGPSVRLDRDETRRQLGPDADARAFLLLRTYCPEAVKVYVDDEADPTPYWIVSTRRATELAGHLNTRIMKD